MPALRGVRAVGGVDLHPRAGGIPRHLDAGAGGVRHPHRRESRPASRTQTRVGVVDLGGADRTRRRGSRSAPDPRRRPRRDRSGIRRSGVTASTCVGGQLERPAVDAAVAGDEVRVRSGAPRRRLVALVARRDGLREPVGPEREGRRDDEAPRIERLRLDARRPGSRGRVPCRPPRSRATSRGRAARASAPARSAAAGSSTPPNEYLPSTTRFGHGRERRAAMRGAHLVGLERHDEVAAAIRERAQRRADAGDDGFVVAGAERVLDSGGGGTCHGGPLRSGSRRSQLRSGPRRLSVRSRRGRCALAHPGLGEPGDARGLRAPARGGSTPGSSGARAGSRAPWCPRR